MTTKTDARSGLPMARLFLATALALPQLGCSIISPLPTLELIKAGGTTAGMAIQGFHGEASNTVYHYHAPFKALCIEFNPQAQMADVVPALQTALRQHSIESRVYESFSATDSCHVWLKYSAFIEWGMPPLSDQYRPFVSTAALTLQTSRGEVLSSSHYALDSTLGISKWASTHDKLAPVVTALITGFSN